MHVKGLLIIWSWKLSIKKKYELERIRVNETFLYSQFIIIQNHNMNENEPKFNVFHRSRARSDF